MKHLLLTFLSLFIASSILAQSEIEVTRRDTVIGKNFKTNTDILATKYVFPERVDNVNIDSLSNLITVRLRELTRNEKYFKGNGTLLLYDMTNHQVKWSQKLSNSTIGILRQGDMIVRVEDFKSYGIDVETGEDKWVVKNKLYLINEKTKMGIGFNRQLFSKTYKTLEGIDLLTGKVMWKRELSSNFDWNSNYTLPSMWDGAFRLNDSLAVVKIRGLHGIYYKSGKGWDYDAKVLTFNLRGYIHDLNSNIIMDSSSIFMASKDQITRLDYDGNKIWTQPLPEDSTSTSSIFFKNGLLYLVNFGGAIRDGKPVFEGRPYLASYDLKTGSQQLFKGISDKKLQINSYLVRKDTIILSFNKKLSKYSLKDGSLLFEKPFETDSLKEPSAFWKGSLYLKVDSTYKRLDAVDSTNYYLTTTAKKVIKLDNHFEFLNEVDLKQFYILYYGTKELRFISDDTQTVVLDKADKVVATFPASPNAIIQGSKLYDWQKQELRVIDLKDLMGR